jgi:FlaA1/EpsC-like NDP-sugar epimerase/lipopolysaccharide/colanic/teichoic acid biosynthesis glycosyltransferase
MPLKRLLDVSVALVLLVLLAPALLAIAALVRITSPGPALYRARRVGRGFRPFHMLKFRTMVVNADRLGPGLTYNRDPRITHVGCLLRRTRLDELPQLINVLTGDMSLVGPRPEAPEYVTPHNPQWSRVLSVRPGICGLTQLQFAFDEAALLTSSASADRDYMTRILPTKLAIDIEYIERRSLLFDLQLMLRTAAAVGRRVLPERQPVAQPAEPVRLFAIVGGAGGTAAVASGEPQRASESPLTLARLRWRWLRRLPRAVARVLPLGLADAAAVALSYWAALAFRFDGRVPTNELEWLLVALPLVVLVYVATNYLFGLYHHLWRYTSASEVVTLGITGATATAILAGYNLLWQSSRPIPLSVVLLGGLFATVLFTALRYRQRLLTGLMGRMQNLVGSPQRCRTLIVGAGAAGRNLGRALATGDDSRRYELVGFVDDDASLHGRRLHGAKVLGDRSAIARIVAERGVGLVVIAIHAISGATLRELLSICLTTPARVKILPDFMGSIDHTDGAPLLRDIMPEDLLGRQTSAIDAEACRDIIADKVVLVTGAAGSIGSELCRQVLRFGPRALVMLDNNETGLYDLLISLPAERPNTVPVVADVTNPARVEAVFATYLPQVVFHAAAYKHVPLMELHPEEAVRVNVGGTRVVAEQAHRHQVERFVLISSDKAVQPSSVMGATKRLGELLMLELADHAQHARTVGERYDVVRPATLFTAVRFGNVLGSRGSVVPTFTRQIDQGGPVTVTHEEMTRYFISIPEAVSLVIQAATLTAGGDLFMLDMGQAIQIKDLAHKMIRLRGLRPNVDIPVVFQGIRPGEKLHEELIAPGETRELTTHPRVFRIGSSHDLSWTPQMEKVARLVELTDEQPLAVGHGRFVEYPVRGQEVPS